MDKTKSLHNTTWENKNYYKVAEEGSLNTAHPGMVILKDLAKNAGGILDLGCGEGTRLNFLVSDQGALGVDISKTAISLAKKSFSHLQFKRANLENLPLEDKSFDLVYCAFVLEHLRNPEKVINEAIRVLKSSGYLVFIAPNYGAPNRVSPPFKGSRIKKFLGGIWSDVGNRVFSSSQLRWQEIEPISTKEKYNIDWDTTVEPYLGTLITFLKNKGLKIEVANSCWNQELPNVKLQQKIFKFLGKLEFYPFWMWGPHLLVVARR